MIFFPKMIFLKKCRIITKVNKEHGTGTLPSSSHPLSLLSFHDRSRDLQNVGRFPSTACRFPTKLERMERDLDLDLPTKNIILNI